VDFWRWTEDGLRRLFETNGFDVLRIHRLGELATAGLLLVTYPAGKLEASSSSLMRGIAGAIFLVVNLLAAALDAMARRFLRRHYASPCYLVVATKAGTSS
jgi:hypothetical protein